MQQTAPSGRIDVRLITTDVEWDRLEAAWSELFVSNPDAATPLHFDWMRTWWRIYGPSYGGRDGLRVVSLWRGPELVGVLPLYCSRAYGVHTLRFLSSGEKEEEETCADYLDLLTRPGEEAACHAAVSEYLAGVKWDQLLLLDLGMSSRFPSGLCVPGHNAPRIFERGFCPFADLSGGFENYLQRLSANSRQQARRQLREGAAAGIEIQIADASQADVFFANLVRLHQERWTAVAKPGVFAAPRFVEFHRSLIERWLPSGRVVLAQIVGANDAIAVLYGFRNGPRYEFYQSGIRTKGIPLRSPGNLAHLMLMRSLSGQGVLTYDFLRGTSSYKERLATGQTPLIGLELWRPTIRSALLRIPRTLRHALATRLRRFRRTPARPSLPNQ